MPNKSSPHGGFISEGTIIHGTLRTQDLLLALAQELERVLPFNSHSLVYDARESAATLGTDPEGKVAQITADDILNEIINELDVIADREGFYFGTHPGDGSDFGYWAIEDDND